MNAIILSLLLLSFLIGAVTIYIGIRKGKRIENEQCKFCGESLIENRYYCTGCGLDVSGYSYPTLKKDK
jgi:hypothetical protein